MMLKSLIECVRACFYIAMASVGIVLAAFLGAASIIGIVIILSLSSTAVNIEKATYRFCAENVIGQKQ
jgi:hypothetical protein